MAPELEVPLSATTLASVPVDLRERPRWVVWRSEERNGNQTKVPYQCNGRTKAKSNNPETWGTFAEAEDCYRRGGFDGVGFMFVEGDGLAGVDLDSCRDATTGAIAPWAQTILDQFQEKAYAEVSPSGEGVKLFTRATPRKSFNVKVDPITGAKLTTAGATTGKAPGVECYGSRRYFAVTGEVLDGFGTIADAQGEVDVLVQRFAPQRHTTPPSNGHVMTAPADVLERARRYVAAMPAAVSGNFGHNTTFAVACALRRGFELSEADTMQILREYNARCEPPWSEAELAHKAQDAGRAEGERGYLLNAGFMGSTNGAPRLRLATIPEVGDSAAIPGIDVVSGRTDRANALRFVATHGGDVHWCEPWRKWLVWDSRRWALDNALRTDALAKQTADQYWQTIAANVRHAEAAQMLAFARGSASARGIRDCLAMARSEPGIPVLPAALDTHPWLLNVGNGVIDLRTGALRPHDRALLLTKLTEIDYQPDAQCPQWERAIATILGDDTELIEFVQRLFGSALVGQVLDHVLPIFWGCGANGKTLATEAILGVFGEYGGKAAPDLLLTRSGQAHPTEKADLFGKRLVLVAETDEGRRLSESVVKELTGGDTINARRMREDFWTFTPSHTVVLVTNHKPRVSGTDHALWRRLRLVPFTETFWAPDKGETGPANRRADKELPDKLRAERPGILAWLVRGCVEWQRVGLGQPDRVQDATNEYRDAEDTLAAFLAEHCQFRPDGRCKASDLLDRYVLWARLRGERGTTGRRLSDYLARRGITKLKSSCMYYAGLVLR